MTLSAPPTPTWGACTLIVSINSFAVISLSEILFTSKMLSLHFSPTTIVTPFSLCCIHDRTSYFIAFSYVPCLCSLPPCLLYTCNIDLSSCHGVSQFSTFSCPCPYDMTFILTLVSASFLSRQRCAGGSLRPLVAPLRRRLNVALSSGDALAFS